MKELNDISAKEQEQVLYSMGIHGTVIFNNSDGVPLRVTRVPGGWVYQYTRLDANSMWAVFVPEPSSGYSGYRGYPL